MFNKCNNILGKLPAADLGQKFICDIKTGFECYNLENSQDCFDYEISFFCACDEDHTVSPGQPLVPGVTKPPGVTGN